MSLEDPRRRRTASGERLPVCTRLSASGHWAELTADDLTETGVVLSTGPSPEQMSEQSHVELEDPGWLLHDYTHRMSSVLRAAALRLWEHSDAAAPASALHLGAGALTLPRWIEERWPQSVQTVLDIEPELVDFVLEHLPMRTRPESIVADAAEALRPVRALHGRCFDVVVVDLFNSAEAPAELTSPEFLSAVLERVTPQGLLLMNLGDDAGMLFARSLVRRLLEAAAGAVGSLGAAQTAQTEEAPASAALLTAPDPVIAGAEEGNLVFAWTPSSSFTEQELHRIWAAGPHPGEVLTGAELESWAS